MPSYAIIIIRHPTVTFFRRQFVLAFELSQIAKIFVTILYPSWSPAVAMGHNNYQNADPFASRPHTESFLSAHPTTKWFGVTAPEWLRLLISVAFFPPNPTMRKSIKILKNAKRSHICLKVIWTCRVSVSKLKPLKLSTQFAIVLLLCSQWICHLSLRKHVNCFISCLLNSFKNPSNNTTEFFFRRY